MLILGIETSCDETAAAVVRNGRDVLSDVVASQIAVHSPYGGVVPELASRKHVEAIVPVVGQAVDRAGCSLHDLDAVAVTQGPGLVGALLVGLSAAKGLAYALNKPLLAVNHLEGHMEAAFLDKDRPQVPFICLVVSGGHTSLYHVSPDGTSRCVGHTRDDAAGEAYDKVAKLLGLGYPGGVIIDRLAQRGNPIAFEFPRSRLEKGSLDFSFSGIKTAVAYFVKRYGSPGEEGHGEAPYRLEDLAASFQEAVVDVLVEKTLQAAERYGVGHVALAGGVAANSRLRRRMEEECAYRRLQLHVPSVRHCTDNAVMVAAAGYRLWLRQGFTPDPLELDAVSRLP
ncbi:O-sialoglycoprotein endopeptidase [Desulfacinum hydrothermale DSM 13146]|uniref:tRNA N6-adenosine threonylcarbamoyltransferase n=1 Tax=Desulfacinum hydrothermale DSM 13146 TaxID=1121390 RepID=A0A1W1XKA9_9BACT|nr:tRNA (adenosine(37)-N6)-threonylcarbamoyltransferase complex transferase subunit TsaD [Desulfacinum hydrothermale]SMC24247.1 O-sialoglycoprotein endopeptidase [Desulfacinum hydrothermale DSM 13146]